MAKDYQSLLRDYFAEPLSKPLRPKELAQELGLGKNDYKRFKDAIEALVAEGRLLMGSNKLVRSAAPVDTIAGTVKRTGKGNGYFRSHDPAALEADESLYIFPEDLKDAYTGDEVLVQLLRTRNRGQRCGRVVEILSRGSKAFVGSYFERRDHGFVRIDGNQFESAISVGDPGAKGVIPEDRVVVEMLRFPSRDDAGEAVITKVLGVRGAPGVDLLTIIHEFELPDEFPEAVLAEARLQAQMFEEEEASVVRGSVASAQQSKEPLTLALSPQGRGEGTGEEATTFDDSQHSSLSPRLDLTRDTIITIDPIDARDFDDAISLTREDDGNWRLGVHIADVAHFVRPGTLLDREAHARGTSVYLPDKVLPMLPEVISNALASLQQGRVRYTKSAFITFSPEGIPLDSEFANSKINVTQRFAYEQVMPLISGWRVEGGGLSGGEEKDGEAAPVPSPPSSGERARVRGPSGEDGLQAKATLNADPEYDPANSNSEGRTPHPNPLPSKARGEGTREEVPLPPQPSVAPHVLALLRDMHGLAMILRKRRFARGALDLNLPEVKIDMTRDGAVVGAHRASHDESHEIIEEFMLAANIAVATKLTDCGHAFLRRTHDSPDELKLRVLGEFAKSLGYKTKPMPGRADLQKLLKEVQGTPHEYAISYAILRSMKQAMYGPDDDIGHYALAEDNYAHFTSPIRRYPDLTIHRLLDEVIRKEGGVAVDGPDAHARRAATVVPSPPSSGERARVRGPSGEDGCDADTSEDIVDNATSSVVSSHTERGDGSSSELRVDEGGRRAKKKPKAKTPHPSPLPAKPGRGDKNGEGNRTAGTRRENGNDDGRKLSRFPSALIALGKWCSLTERRAQEAERELIKLKLLGYLANHIGDELHATITGVEKFGLFCTGIELPAEGLVHISTMGDDQYDYDDRSHTLVGRRSNRTYRLGDFVKVVVAKVDLAERKLELRLVVDPRDGTNESRRRETQSRQDREAPRHGSHGPPKRGRRR